MGKQGRTTGGTIFRMFGGKKFLLTRQFVLKGEANTYANNMRKRGYLVRVNKEKSMLGRVAYFVYRRARTGK